VMRKLLIILNAILRTGGPWKHAKTALRLNLSCRGGHPIARGMVGLAIAQKMRTWRASPHRPSLAGSIFSFLR
jgi:hypothetical protein